jgi:hypothetical protein
MVVPLFLYPAIPGTRKGVVFGSQPLRLTGTRMVVPLFLFPATQGARKGVVFESQPLRRQGCDVPSHLDFHLMVR